MYMQSHVMQSHVSFLCCVCVATALACAGCGGKGGNKLPLFDIATHRVSDDGTVGVNYYTTLSTNKGVGPYRWTISGALPPGLAVKAFSSVLSEESHRIAIVGIPTASGSFPFTAYLTDAQGHRAQKSFTMKIRQQPARPRWRVSASIPRIRSNWPEQARYDLILKIYRYAVYTDFGDGEEFRKTGVETGTGYVQVDLGFDYVVYEDQKIRIDVVIDPDDRANAGQAKANWYFEGLPALLQTPVDVEELYDFGVYTRNEYMSNIPRRLSAVRL